MKYITNQAPLGTALANLHLHNRKREGSPDYIDKFGFETIDINFKGIRIRSNGTLNLIFVHSNYRRLTARVN